MVANTLPRPGTRTDVRRRDRESITNELLRAAASASEPERRRLVDEVVLLNRGLAESVASRYRGRGVDRDDLVQVAYLGLINATRRFDPDRGKDFASFACPTMSGEIKRHFRDHAWTVRPPRRVQEMHSRLSTAITDVAQRRGTWPSTRDLAEYLGVETGDVAEASASHECFTVSSLDYRRDDEDDTSLGDAVGSEDAGFDRAEALVALGPACCDLGTRDRRILYLRFFRGWTQQEIADELGVSQMQISRLLSRILRQLRQSIGVTDDQHHDEPVAT